MSLVMFRMLLMSDVTALLWVVASKVMITHESAPSSIILMTRPLAATMIVIREGRSVLDSSAEMMDVVVASLFPILLYARLRSGQWSSHKYKSTLKLRSLFFRFPHSTCLQELVNTKLCTGSSSLRQAVLRGLSEIVPLDGI